MSLLRRRSRLAVVGTPISVSGGYDFEPEWLGGLNEVRGTVNKWIPGQNKTPACVVLLDEPLEATGDVRGVREVHAGPFLILELRYVNQKWEGTGKVHVELCDAEPLDLSWSDRLPGAWVESHATYNF